MKNIDRYITPLSVFFVISLMSGVLCIIFSDRHGWRGMAGLMQLMFLALPSLIGNVLTNLIIKNRSLKNIVQAIILVAMLGIYYAVFGPLGMP